MSWLFSQAVVEAFSAGTSLAGKPCAQLNVMPTVRPFWHRDKMIESLNLSRYGQTSRRLTPNRGEELLMSCLAVFRARTSAARAEEPGCLENDPVSGTTWRGSLATYDRTSRGWKIPHSLWDGDLEQFLETWPRWGSMRSGESSAQPIPVLRIFANESGSWPTPLKADASRKNLFDTNNPRNGLPPAVRCAALAWATPTASLGTKGGLVTPRKGREGGTLVEAVSARMWPTPTVCMSKGSSPAALVRKTGKSRANDRLDHAVLASVLAWPTPTAGSSHAGGYLGEWGGKTAREKMRTLVSEEELFVPLNPMWVEWLMAFPRGWTDLAPLATHKFHEWRLQHGNFSFIESGRQHDTTQNQ